MNGREVRATVLVSTRLKDGDDGTVTLDRCVELWYFSSIFAIVSVLSSAIPAEDAKDVVSLPSA